MTWLRLTDLEPMPTTVLDMISLMVVGFHALISIFAMAFQAYMAVWWLVGKLPRSPTLYHLQKLSAADAHRSPVIHHGLSQNQILYKWRTG